MDRFLCGMWVLAAALAGLGTFTLAAPRQIDYFSACPRLPLACLPSSRPSQCLLDSDCQPGSRCCYRGCVRRCQAYNPCDRVICKQGHVCQSRETPCHSPPCQPEAVCLSEATVRCLPLPCGSSECQPGFTRGQDSSGCPTCQCVQKPDCTPVCKTFCAHGYEEDDKGCRTCVCIPEPHNPCSNVRCGQRKECRLVQLNCTQAPCQPKATCVKTLKVQFENTCSLSDPSTVDLPVLLPDHKSELDCFTQTCPDHTVCTTMGRSLHRCCWQSTQEEVLSAAKAGECPDVYLINFRQLHNNRCQLDGQCPRDQKCCYRQNRAPYFGSCMDPVHKIIENATAECQRSSLVKSVFTVFKLC